MFKLATLPRFDTLLAYGFRPFFLLLPIYIAVTIVVWALFWSGTISLGFTGEPLVWHLYEMSFGIVSAGAIGFLLTAIPEFFPDHKQVSGRLLAFIVLLWCIGRLCFWLMGWLGPWLVALTNLPLLMVVTVLIAKPILQDPMRKHWGILWVLLLLIALQWTFFLAQLGFTSLDIVGLLRLTVGVVMVLELIALRRIIQGVANIWLTDNKVDERFFSKPPSYHIAVTCILLFSFAEFYLPNNKVLGWLGLACMAAVLNILNDFFQTEVRLLFKAWIWPLALVLVLMATGYGLLGVDYLNDNLYGLNHFRHFLTTGVIGLSLLFVMIIVSTVHTGRELAQSHQFALPILFILVATCLRASIPFAVDYGYWFYGVSAALWALPFIYFAWRFAPWLLAPRVDGNTNSHK